MPLAMGPGLDTAFVGQVAEFYVVTDDIKKGKPHIVASGLTNDIDVTISQLNDTVFSCSYTPVYPGIHLINILLSDRLVRGSPFQVKVTPAPSSQLIVQQQLADNKKVSIMHSAVTIPKAVYNGCSTNSHSNRQNKLFSENENKQTSGLSKQANNNLAAVSQMKATCKLNTKLSAACPTSMSQLAENDVNSKKMLPSENKTSDQMLYEILSQRLLRLLKMHKVKGTTENLSSAVCGHSSKKEELDNNEYEHITIHRKNMHACYFCKSLLINMSYHLLNEHKHQFEIKLIYKMKNEDYRKIAIQRMIFQGDYAHNRRIFRIGAGEIIVAKILKGTLASDYLPCPYCLSYISDTLIAKHKMSCTYVPTDAKQNVKQSLKSKTSHDVATNYLGNTDSRTIKSTASDKGLKNVKNTLFDGDSSRIDSPLSSKDFSITKSNFMTGTLDSKECTAAKSSKTSLLCKNLNVEKTALPNRHLNITKLTTSSDSLNMTTKFLPGKNVNKTKTTMSSSMVNVAKSLSHRNNSDIARSTSPSKNLHVAKNASSTQAFKVGKSYLVCKDFYEEVIKGVPADRIWKICSNDKLIVLFARSIYDKNTSMTGKNVRAKMRHLAELLLTLREQTNTSKSLDDFIVSQSFKDLVSAIKACCTTNKVKGTEPHFTVLTYRPSEAHNLALLVQKCVTVKFEVASKEHNSAVKEDMKKLTILLKSEWAQKTLSSIKKTLPAKEILEKELFLNSRVNLDTNSTSFGLPLARNIDEGAMEIQKDMNDSDTEIAASCSEDEGSANSDIIPLLMKRKCLHATNSMKDVVMRENVSSEDDSPLE